MVSILGTLSLVAALLVLVMVIYSLIKGRIKQALLLFLALIGYGIAFLFLSFLLFFLPIPDYFARNLKIPEGIELHHPIEYGQECQPHVEMGLMLYTADIQSGLYRYSVFLPTIEEGHVYLRAFEITKNTALSVRRLREQSKMPVFNRSDSVARFTLPDQFIIYEGDPGNPYAARFEVWFVPENGDREYKLMERNFIIEGWRR